jgi:uncharacterized protein YecE (DUF72 family)
VRPLHVGCSGWNYESWRGAIYPDDLPRTRWLERYAELFDTVEVNNTFYRLPEKKTVAAWGERTPEGFEFAIKASRYLTHVKRLKGIGQGIRRFMARIRPLREQGKLGPLLWQLPGNFQRDDRRLERFLDVLPEGRHAIELRHPSWFDDHVYAALGEAGVALVIGDHPERPFQTHEMTAPWTFVRLHYGHRGRRGNYSDAELATWKRRITAWRRKREVYVYLNNDWEAFAPANALKLL